MIPLFLLPCIVLAATPGESSVVLRKTHAKALLVFVDGFIPGAIATTETPAIDRIMKRAAWSLRARAESTTISGSGWSTFVTGVHWDKHGVPDNKFEAPRFGDYPHVFKRLKEARPDAVVASAQSWRPIEDGLVTPSAPDHASFHDYYDYDDDYWDDESCDALVARDMARFLMEPAVDLAVIMFGELDGVGHSERNAHYDASDALYQKMLARIDGHLGRLLDAIESRPTYGREDWLVVVSSDHGGSRDGGHGRNIPAHREIPFIAGGPSVAVGEIWPPPQAADVVATALHHLGVTLRPEWELDGRPVGFETTAPPPAALDTNLIENGGAELERGFDHYVGVPDASIAAWNDPGRMTVVRYGATEGFPGDDDPRPGNAGRNFFAGGSGGDSWAEQVVDLTPLAEAVRAGATFELSAWLGGYADQHDRTQLTARFLSVSRETLARVTLGPVTAEERGGATGLLHRVESGSVPKDARSVVVRLEATADSGGNDGYADEISLVIRR